MTLKISQTIHLGLQAIKEYTPSGTRFISCLFTLPPEVNDNVSSGQVSEKKPKKTKNEENTTTVTKWVSKLAGGLFVRTLLVCDSENTILNKDGLKAAAEEENMTMEALIDITSGPEAVRRAGWTGRDETVHIDLVGVATWKDKKRGRTGYASAVVDGVIINPGDFVTVR
jgi:hypothetical protein